MEFTEKTILILTFIIMFAIMLVSSTYIWPNLKQQNLFMFEEKQLEKIPLKIKAGEYYKYGYDKSEELFNITYEVKQGPGCLYITIKEIKGANTVCLKQDGTDANGSNLTLSNQLVQFFKPWMLAVKPNWNWSVTMKSSVYVNLTMETYEFKEIGETKINGREAYVVVTTINGKNQIKLYIDKEKRVLLREEGLDYTIDLISSPFLSQQQAG